MYAERLGSDRARAMNPFAAMAAAGVELALSSDAPVTPVDPWGGVRAAVRHRSAGSALSPRAAFAAATRGGWHAARADGDGSGTLRPGAPATFAIWRAPAGDAAGRAARPRRAPADPPDLDGLPDLDAPAPAPECLRTVVRGAVVHDVLG
jgi:predicted amidohydrolase YtcJ